MNYKKIILHIDANAFFASVERIIDPSLKNKPIIITRNTSRSVVITSTYDLRKIGIKAGKPIFKIKNKCPKNTVFITPKYEKYAEASAKLFLFLYNNYSKKIQIASIDECYLDVTEIWKEYKTKENLSRDIIKSIYENLHIPCSIGVSFTPFFAKMANKFTNEKTFFVISPSNFKKLIWPLLINELYGVGPKMTKTLKNHKITNGMEYILNYPKYQNTSLKSKNYANLYYNLSGKGSRELSYEKNFANSFGKESTLEKPISSLFHIKKLMVKLLSDIFWRCSENSILAKSFEIKIE